MTPDAGARWSHERQSRAALAAAIAMMFIWGANFGVTKFVLGALGVGPFLFIRFATTSLLAFLLLAIVYRHHLPKSWPRRDDLPRFALAGVIGHTLHVGIVTWGIDLSTAFSSALVLTSGPLWTLLILSVLGVERLRRRQLVGTVVAFLGIVVFLSEKFTAGFSMAGVGDLVLLFAASLFSFYTVISKPLVVRYGPLPLLAYTLLFGAPPLLLLTLPAFLAAPLADISGKVWLGMFWAAVVSAFLGWIVWTWVNAVRGVARSAPLQYLMPPIAGVVAWFTLGESFSALKIGGAALAMAGVAWAQFGGAGPPPRESAQPDSG